MKLYCIVTDLQALPNPDTLRLLKEACEARDIAFEPIDAKTFRYDAIDSLDLGSEDLLYRLGASNRARLLEALLINKKPRTLYRNAELAIYRNDGWGAVIAMQHAGVPIVPTIFGVTAVNGEDLAAYVDKLGGFPIIVKASGGSHGSSVLRVDSIESLRSVLGYVTHAASAEFVLRKYVHAATHFRYVVLGDKVLDVIKYTPQQGDFRTNTGLPQVVGVEPDEAYSKIAVQAVHASGVAFGGVDVLVGSDHTPYVAEVNFPCNFARNQMNSGADIAGQMVDYLAKQ